MIKNNRCGNVEPDLSQCRTGKVGVTIPGGSQEMFYCRIDKADCRFAMSFAYDLLCKHPDAHSFILPEGEDLTHVR